MQICINGLIISLVNPKKTL